MWEAPAQYCSDDYKANIKNKIKKNPKPTTAKREIFQCVDELLEVSEIHLFWEGAPCRLFFSLAI